MGGKSRIAGEVWARFGDCPNYVEPFAGSLAVLLARPTEHRGGVDPAHDAARPLVNFSRATTPTPSP